MLQLRLQFAQAGAEGRLRELQQSRRRAEAGPGGEGGCASVPQPITTMHEQRLFDGPGDLLGNVGRMLFALRFITFF